MFLRSLDAGSGWSAHVQSHFSGVDLWKEIPAKMREQQQRPQHQDGEESGRKRGLRNGPRQTVAIGFAKSIEPALEAVVDRGEWSLPPAARRNAVPRHDAGRRRAHQVLEEDWHERK